MKLTIDIDEGQLTSILKKEISDAAKGYFEKHKEPLFQQEVEKQAKSLKTTGFFTKQITSNLNKAIYDKVNREFSEFIAERVKLELDLIFKNKSLRSLVDTKIEEKAKEILKRTLNGL